ncbi:MAG: hypothetical protein ACI9XP_001094, partial [Lentimonas sp.]
MKAFFQRFKRDIIFVLLFAAMAISYYDGVLEKGPYNMHLWRQTDCLSITQMYSEGADLFSPEMHIQLADKNTSGKTAGEFPILYYAVGKLWSWTGQSYFTYRLIWLIVLFFGVFSLFKTLQLTTKNDLISFLIPLLLFTSPVFVFYGVSFLTDAPAFSFILIGIYFFTKHHFSSKSSFLYWACFFFLLAGLIKVSSLIAFIFLGFILLLELFGISSVKNSNLFPFKKKALIAFILTVLGIFSWYYYASIYNEAHSLKYTFNSVYTFFDIPSSDMQHWWYDFRDLSSVIFLSRPLFILLLLVAIFNLFLWRKLPKLLYLMSPIILLGSLLYFFLWAPLMAVHDYYFVALLILIPAIFTPFCWFLKEAINSKVKVRVLSIFGFLFLVYNFIYCLQVTKLKTGAQNGEFAWVGNEKFTSNMRYINWDVAANWKSLERIQPELRKWGVKKEDLFICLPDGSFNVSLFLVGQKGWTNFLNYNTSEQIENLIDKGAKYLLIMRRESENQEFLESFKQVKIGEFENL